jgi:hypothetical protein
MKCVLLTTAVLQFSCQLNLIENGNPYLKYNIYLYLKCWSQLNGNPGLWLAGFSFSWLLHLKYKIFLYLKYRLAFSMKFSWQLNCRTAVVSNVQKVKCDNEYKLQDIATDFIRDCINSLINNFKVYPSVWIFTVCSLQIFTYEFI